MNVREHCKIQDCFVYSNITRYLNQISVKKRLGVRTDLRWETCAMGEVSRPRFDIIFLF